VVRTDDGDSESFAVNVGLHQGSGLSPLLFIIVMDVITKEIHEGLPWEILYADDVVLIATCMEELKDKMLRWKATMEAKGLKVNIGKTKVMMSCDGPGEVSESGRWPCGVCRTGVGSNSVECTHCAKWVQKNVVM
jgi:hypothetical protein